MSGTSLELTYADHTRPIVDALRRVIDAGRRPRPLLLQIGEYLVRSTQERFDAQKAPDGTPWQEVQPARMAIKRIKKILTESSRLRDSVVSRAGEASLEWGTNVIYSRVHQEGGKTAAHVIRPRAGKALFFPGLSHPVKAVNHPGSEIPARPFLGISDEDCREILVRVHDFCREAVSG